MYVYSGEIKVCGIIKYLQVRLANHLALGLSMDVVVVDIPDSWGMLLSRKWSAKFRR